MVNPVKVVALVYHLLKARNTAVLRPQTIVQIVQNAVTVTEVKEVIPAIVVVKAITEEISAHEEAIVEGGSEAEVVVVVLSGVVQLLK